MSELKLVRIMMVVGWWFLLLGYGQGEPILVGPFPLETTCEMYRAEVAEVFSGNKTYIMSCWEDNL